MGGILGQIAGLGLIAQGMLWGKASAAAIPTNGLEGNTHWVPACFPEQGFGICRIPTNTNLNISTELAFQ